MCVLAPKRDAEGFKRVMEAVVAAIAQVWRSPAAPSSPSAPIKDGVAKCFLSMSAREWDAIESYRDEYAEFQRQPGFAAARVLAHIAEMDDETVASLRRFRREYARASEQRDQESTAFFERAIEDLLFPLPGADVQGGIDEPYPALAAGTSASKRGGNSRFADLYTQLKAASGLLTVEQVAERAGLHPNTVRMVEQGQCVPRFETLAKLAGAFGAEASVLVGAARGRA